MGEGLIECKEKGGGAKFQHMIRESGQLILETYRGSHLIRHFPKYMDNMDNM